MASGDTAAARQLLQTACHTAERLGARLLLDHCAAALASLATAGVGGVHAVMRAAAARVRAGVATEHDKPAPSLA